ncbi:MAG: hypothetical protein ACYS22_05690, partial [Planctomycetota bacterium]
EVAWLVTPIGLYLFDVSKATFNLATRSSLVAAHSEHTRLDAGRLAVIRGLERVDETQRIASDFEPVLDLVSRGADGDRALCESAFATLKQCFADDDRLTERDSLMKLLDTYERYDRTDVRRLLSSGPGRTAIKPLRRIKDDENVPMHYRVVAASCLMELSTFRKQEGFLFALERLDHPEASAREESYAVLKWFAGFEALRNKSRVVDTVMRALTGDEERADRAKRIVRSALRGSRSRSLAEPVVLEHLGENDAPLQARRSVWEIFGKRRDQSHDPDEIGRLAMRDLNHPDEAVRAHVLAALAELRRQLDGVEAPFEDAAAARAWWAGR